VPPSTQSGNGFEQRLGMFTRDLTGGIAARVFATLLEPVHMDTRHVAPFAPPLRRAILAGLALDHGLSAPCDSGEAVFSNGQFAPGCGKLGGLARAVVAPVASVSCRPTRRHDRRTSRAAPVHASHTY
jgi:hypothetical protein